MPLRVRFSRKACLVRYLRRPEQNARADLGITICNSKISFLFSHISWDNENKAFAFINIVGYPYIPFFIPFAFIDIVGLSFMLTICPRLSLL